MDYGYAKLGGDKRAGKRGIDIADDDDSVRFLCQQNRFEAAHDFGCLLRVATGPNV
jgi:hypothetical protein